MKQYYFYDRPFCEMCGSSTEKHKIKGLHLNTSQGFKPRKKIGIAVAVQQCTTCGLIYSNPLPVPVNIDDHYSIPPENYWFDSYFQSEESYFQKEITIFKELSEFKHGMKALDVGAGIGKCMASLQNAGFDAYGFDPSKPFYERAISKMGINPERLKLGMIEDMDYEPEKFDFINFGAVLEHLYHPADCIDKAMKWLKPGGLIHLEVPSARCFTIKLINFYNRLCGTNYTSHLSPMHSPYHLYEFNIKSFQALGEKLKFKVVKHHIEVCEIMNFPRITHPFFKAIMKSTNTGMQLIVWIRKA